MPAEDDAYHELCFYTLSHGDPAFIHQHVVDAWAAQHADEKTKPIAITFALAGLYLHLEKGFSGRNVQRMHMKMGQRKHEWPKFPLPANRGSITAIDVMAAPAGPERDKAIGDWCRSVWSAFGESRPIVATLMQHYGVD